MADIDFGGVTERVVTRDEYSLDRAKKVLADETVAVIGYGIQGSAQAQNMRDNGIDVIVAQREGSPRYDLALEDGWIPEITLFSLEDAVFMGTMTQYLLRDADQMTQWPVVRENLKEGDALYFSHGFSIVYGDQTGVVPPENVDVILVAPKGAGRSVRDNFLKGQGINSSFAVHQDYTGRAEERALAAGIAIGSGYLFPTTFEREVHSDLTGERGVLLGGLWGMFEAQYAALRAHGHSPSEAYNETVEELTESLIRFVSERGMDHLLANCSETARRGALDWGPRFRGVVTPLFEELYGRVVSGEETRRVIEASQDPNYRQTLATELETIANSEMWRVGAAVRSLRPRK